MRLALRLAWRAAKRERLATFLTALLVALPVVALVAAGVLARSAVIPHTLDLQRQFGQSNLVVARSPDRDGETVADDPPTALLPVGSRMVTDVARAGDTLLSPTSAFEGSVAPFEFDYTDELARGVVVPRTGRAPVSPDEVAVTTYLANRFRIHLGDTLHLTALGERRVVGTVVDPGELQTRAIYGRPGAFAALGAEEISYLVQLPPGVDAARVTLPQRYQVSPRDGSGTSSALPSQNAIDSGALVILLALLEASLTAGTAFAVGARRRRRDLALIAVNGGRAAHTGGVVLANGLVCGVIGVAVGIAGGLVGARVGFPHLQDHIDQLLPGLRIDPLLLVAAAVFGMVSALISAGFPAVLAARGSLRNALGKTRGSSGTPGWITVAGVGVFGLGIAVMSAAVRDASRGNGQQTTTALLGVVFVELGGVAVCPALLGLAGRFGARLPALPRLALRDSARQRARSGPAVAAIAAAVSGAMALSVYLASDHLGQVRRYQPAVPRNLVTVSPDQRNGSGVPALASLLGPAAARQATVSYDFADHAGNFLYASFDLVKTVPFAADLGGEVAVADPELVRLLGATPAAETAFASGSALVATSGPQPGFIRFRSTDSAHPPVTAAVAATPSGWAATQGRPIVVISPTTATRLLASLPGSSAAPSPADPVRQQNRQLWAPLPPGLSNAARESLRERGSDLDLYLNIDSGPGETRALQSLALLGVAALFSLIVTAAATVLAAAESQADLSILGAVGASGLSRRMFTAAQGGTTAMLGGVLGIAIGLVPGIAVVQATVVHLPLAVPWQPFVAFLVALPVIAGLGGLVFSRSRLPGVTRTL